MTPQQVACFFSLLGSLAMFVLLAFAIWVYGIWRINAPRE
jgi:hypothetical protein